MNITLSAIEVEHYRRANPGHGLDGLTGVTFTFDANGEVINCTGTTKGTPNQQLFARIGLSRLCNIARERWEASRSTTNQTTAVILPFKRPS